MSGQRNNKRSIVVLSVILAVVLLAVIGLIIYCVWIDDQLSTTSDALATMTALREDTIATLESTETELAKTQVALSDMTSMQEQTAAELASVEVELTETQTELEDMTALQAETSAALALSEETLSETQTALETANAENKSLRASLQGASQTGVVGETVPGDIQLTGTDSAEYVVMGEYEWEKYGHYNLALIVKNTSGGSKAINAQVLFYGEDGGLLGASNPEQYVCGDSENALLSCSCDSEYAYYEYSIELIDEQNCVSCNSFVDVTATVNPNNVILMCTNSGELKPRYVEYNCLFFDSDGNIVGHDRGYIDEPEPGKSTFCEIDVYESFDRCEIYYVAWGSAS